MFILNNIHDRNYRKMYKGIKDVIFDFSEKQISNAKNADWNELTEGSIVCVVKSSRKVSTFFKVTSKVATGDRDPEDGEYYVLTGDVVGKLAQETDMTILFNRNGVVSPRIKNNRLGNGFNVANLGESLDKITVNTRAGTLSIEQLKSINA